MAIITVTGEPVVGIKYTQITDSSVDWSGVSNSTYFYDKTDRLVHYKDVSGTVLEIFSSTGGGGGTFTGGTVSGATIFTNGLTATTISATTYLNLPTNTDVFVTGATYSNNTFTYTNNTGGTFSTLFNTMTGLTITGNLTVTGGTKSIFSGNSSSDLVRITQTGSGNAFVVEDSANPDNSNFTINSNGDVGIGIAPDNQFKTYMYTNLSAQTTTLYVQNQSSNASSIGTAIYGLGLSTGVLGIANSSNTPIGINGFASDGVTVIGVSGSAGRSEFGSADTTIGGYFDSTADYGGGSVGSYSVQLVDGTQGINKVLVSKTADGKANWSSTLSGLTSVAAVTVSATTLIGDGSQITNLPSTSSVPYGIISAIASGNYLI